MQEPLTIWRFFWLRLFESLLLYFFLLLLLLCALVPFFCSFSLSFYSLGLRCCRCLLLFTNLFFVALHKTTAVAKQRKQKIVKFSVWVKRFAICVWFAHKSSIRTFEYYYLLLLLSSKDSNGNRVITLIEITYSVSFCFLLLFFFQNQSHPAVRKKKMNRGSIWRPIFMSRIIFRGPSTDRNTFSVFRWKLIWKYLKNELIDKILK